ncbi:MAG TPA: hypothetical protein VHB21_00630, partial [Minicystis sp.]|nr:hypothetical protein [Minicystis sp.]
SGPFVRLFANGKEVGDDVPEGDLDLEVRVDAAPWVDVDRVELWVDGEIAETWTGPFAAGAKRFDQRTKKRLARGDFVIAVARGSKPMVYLHRPGARPFGFTNPIFVR